MTKFTDISTRATAALLMFGVAIIHAVDAPDQESYLKGLFVTLAVASVIVALALMRGSWSWAWGSAVLLAGATIIGFVISRTAGLPAASDDVGNWGEPLGVASLIVEGLMVALGAAVLLARPRTERRAAEPRRRTRIASATQ